MRQSTPFCDQIGCVPLRAQFDFQFYRRAKQGSNKKVWGKLKKSCRVINGVRVRWGQRRKERSMKRKRKNETQIYIYI